MTKVCAFCDPYIINSQRVFENDSFHVLLDYKPLAPGHLLIISKRCIVQAENMTAKENQDLLQARQKVTELFAKAYKTDQYTELTKTGPDAGQTVRHFHSHMVPIQSSKYRMLGQLMVLAKIALPFCCIRPLKKEAILAEIQRLRAHIPQEAPQKENPKEKSQKEPVKQASALEKAPRTMKARRNEIDTLGPILSSMRLRSRALRASCP